MRATLIVTPHITTVWPVDDILDLAAVVVEERPEYAPPVVDGSVNLHDWFHDKQPEWARVARYRGHLIGHVSVRAHRHLDNGPVLPDAATHELCRLMVHPRWRGLGIASLLVDAAVAEYGSSLWAVVAPSSDADLLLGARSWVEVGQATFYDEPKPGNVLVCKEDA